VRSIIGREYDWVVEFDGGELLIIECLWRLTEAGRIRFTSRDDGHQFGLPAPVNAAEEANRRLEGALVESVELCDGTLDLDICFGGGYALQVIPWSLGYESWHLIRQHTTIVAFGGGSLGVFRGEPLT
jgi:hypothetical protein